MQGLISNQMDFTGVSFRANACATTQLKRNEIFITKNGFWGPEGSGIGAGSKITKLGMKKKKIGSPCSVVTSDISPETMYFKAPSIDRHADPKGVAAIILCGGTGTHLFPLTSTRATPAVPVGGCYKLIDIPMSNCFNSGINKVFIMTQFNSASLNRHISRTYNLGNGVTFGDGFVEVLAATQTSGEAGMNWFQGTADAVRQFSWVLEDYKNKDIEHVVILSGDQLYRMDYMKFVQYHINKGADITVSCAPASDSRASDYGLVKIDKSGRITQFSEKPTGPDLEDMKVENGSVKLADNQPYIASMGVYVFNRHVLFNLLKSKYAKSNDFGSDILPSAVTDYHVQSYMFQEYWEDIGTIKSFFDANLALTDQAPKFEFYDPKTPFYTSPRFLPPTNLDHCRIVDAIISHGCFLAQCSVERSIVGVRSRLNTGVDLKDTLMMGADIYETEPEIASLLSEGKVPMGIGENTVIRNCIIDMNARIGKNVVITNKEGVEEADRPLDGFYIRSGIPIVPKNATIKDGTVI
ncbi:hypothetical protein LUZ60_000667 [Juncus effusus]|nr:hypothetical protein LUZ60_000667 [Juncus effusus]